MKIPKIKSEEESIREDWKNWLYQSEGNSTTYRLPTEKDIADYWLSIIKERDERLIEEIITLKEKVIEDQVGEKEVWQLKILDEVISIIKQTN